MRATLLRDPETDEIRPHYCKVCREVLRTDVDMAEHEIQHSAEGRLVPVMTPHMMLVEFWKPSEYERSMGYDSKRLMRLKPEALDMTTNAVRPKCQVCGDLVHPSFHVDRGRFWIHYRMREAGRTENWTRDANSFREEDHDPQVLVEVEVPS